MKQFEIKNILGNSQKRTYRREIWRQRLIGIAYLLLAIFIGIAIYSACNGGIQISSPDTVGQTVEVKAIEETTHEYQSPVSDLTRRYNNYSYMPDYDYIISELQMLYINWEDAADLNSYENGFNPMAINPTSGACGLSQALPCEKMSCELGDIKCDLAWQKEYISNRYGTVTKALEFWHINNWY